MPQSRPAATLAATTDGPTRLNALTNLFRYDLRRALGVADALRGDPLAVVALLCLMAGTAVGGGWAIATRGSQLPPDLILGAAAVLGWAFGLALRPLPRLRAGPLAELAEDGLALGLWLGLRGLLGLAAVAALMLPPALAMGWRPDRLCAAVVVLAAAGVVSGSAIQLAPPLPRLRLPTFATRGRRGSPAIRDRAFRLAWIDLCQIRSRLPLGVWAGLAWIGAGALGFIEADPQLRPVTEGAAAALAFLGTVLILRFDLAVVRLLTFEPTSFRRLALDVLGVRVLVVALAAVALAVSSGLGVLAGAAIGAGFRTLELMHAARRTAASARLLAQIETALVLALACTVGPLAGVWLAVRLAWLYRRAEHAMGLA